jgi:hypothetical protein
MKDRAQDAPRELPAIQYAGWLCENRIGKPKSKSLLEIIELAIKAVASAKYRDDKWKNPVFSAFCWLDRQCEYAMMAGEKINHLWFMNGAYDDVDAPEKKLPPLITCGTCTEGFVPQMKDGKATGRYEPCACRKSWIAEGRRA